MLDFYILDDKEGIPNPENIETLEYAGGLEYDLFNRLIKKGIIEPRFEYHSDFKWSSQIIKQMIQKINTSEDFVLDSDIKELLKIFNQAESNENGLVAFGD